jgi:hypothetical protein
LFEGPSSKDVFNKIFAAAKQDNEEFEDLKQKYFLDYTHRGYGPKEATKRATRKAQSEYRPNLKPDGDYVPPAYPKPMWMNTVTEMLKDKSFQDFRIMPAGKEILHTYTMPTEEEGMSIVPEKKRSGDATVVSPFFKKVV